MKSKSSSVLFVAALVASLAISGCSGGEEKFDLSEWCGATDSVTECQDSFAETLVLLKQSGYVPNSVDAGEASNLCYGDLRTTSVIMGCMGAYVSLNTN